MNAPFKVHGIMQGRGLICAEGRLWESHRKFLTGYMRRVGLGSVDHHGGKRQEEGDFMEDKIIQLVMDFMNTGKRYL